MILNDKIGAKIGDELSKPSARLLLRKSKTSNQWDFYFLLISNGNNMQNNKITYNQMQDNFPNKIAVFDKDNKIVSSFNLDGENYISGKIMNAPVICTYIGWWYDDGTFEPIMLLGCSGGDGDISPTYGDGVGGHGGGGGSGGNNGDNSGLTMPPPPKTPIADIKKFLSCLNITQPATLNIF